MAALSMGGFFNRFLSGQKPYKRLNASKTAHKIAVDAHRKSKGPTPELRRVYQAYLRNQRQDVGE